jgi:hypothetical protein
MNNASLNALEREVEQVRAKFANDLARLRSPTNLARFKGDLWAEARETQDELIGKGKEAAKDAAQHLVTELKDRAAANPAAALAIGAGLAWRLFQRPPIATLLVGMGVVGLLRTSTAQHSGQPYMGLHDEDPKPQYGNDAGLASQTSALADTAKQKVQDWSTQAGDVAAQTASQLADKAASLADRASDVLHEAGTAASESMTQIADRAAAVSEQASQRLHAAMPDREQRDTLLLGAAALAVAAAVGIAYQRRSQDD